MILLLMMMLKKTREKRDNLAQSHIFYRSGVDTHIFWVTIIVNQK